MYMKGNFYDLVTGRNVDAVTHYYHAVTKLKLLCITNMYRKFVCKLYCLKFNY